MKGEAFLHAFRCKGTSCFWIVGLGLHCVLFDSVFINLMSRRNQIQKVVLVLVGFHPLIPLFSASFYIFSEILEEVTLGIIAR